ncbi:MAG: PaaI family thioesterase [Burkholderiales bacterium]
MQTPDFFNKLGRNHLPGHLGIVITSINAGEVRAEFEVQPILMAPNGFLHAGSIVTLADTCAGYGCITNLPQGASGFTTVELKSNHLGTALKGMVECVAVAAHLGKTTQVWDATVSNKSTGKTIALFRCTQMILYATRENGF